VDVAALLLGRRVEALIADGKTSVAEALSRLEQESGVRGQGSGVRDQGAWANQKWRDPRPYVSKRMEIPESGIW